METLLAPLFLALWNFTTHLLSSKWVAWVLCHRWTRRPWAHLCASCRGPWTLPSFIWGSSLPGSSCDQKGRSGSVFSRGMRHNTGTIGGKRIPWTLVANDWILLWEYLLDLLTWSQTFALLQILPFLIWLTMVELSSQALNEIHKIKGYYACLRVTTSCIQMSPSVMEFLWTICDART